ncbi:hypothetical protein ACHWQZ_G010952 [Mnemiopsis leidyi]
MAMNDGQNGSHEGALASTNTAEKRAPNQNYIAAPNIVKEGLCNHCSKEVNFDKDNAIECYTCGYMFHAVGCSVEDYNVSSPSSFTNHLFPAVNKAKSYKNKFGRFLFICDYCITEKEEATQDVPGVMKNVYVDRKIEELKQSFANELSEVKHLLKAITAPSKEQSCQQLPALSHSAENPWDDSQRTERLRSMVLIKNDNNGKPINKSILEESCGIVNTMTLKKSNDTAIILNSRSDAETLRQKLSQTSPQHTTSTVASKTPRITVVGLEREYSKEEMKEMLVSQNSGINLLVNDPSTSIDDKKVDVVAVLPLKNNQSFKAIVRVSNLIRSVIAKQSDRVYIGTQRASKVYDSFFVLRCFNCQQFGHHSRDCTSNHPVCGFCAGSHETRSCDRSSPECCSNCQRNNKTPDEIKHAAFDPSSCPIFKDLQEKVKKTTPFYQQQVMDKM